MNKSFCVFILTHGRANNCYTYKSLIKIGYDGPLFFLVDNEDKQIDLYKKNFGEERVIVFDKLSISKKTDCADNFQNRRVILHARNACFDVARELGFDYFLELDDDYTGFDFLINSDGSFVKNNLTKNITKVFFSFIDFLESSERIASICFLQGGDLIGGIKCTTLVRGLYPFKKRKAMNSFFCKTSRRFWFTGTINEDVNTYVSLGSRGVIFLSIPLVVLYQKMTQQNAGGMTDAYIASGTYVKSFYSVMINPSSVIAYLGDKSNTVGRIHHRISWNNAVPKILDESHKKA
jgi:hypothetical protein